MKKIFFAPALLATLFLANTAKSQIINISGSSALRYSYMSALRNMCDADLVLYSDQRLPSLYQEGDDLTIGDLGTVFTVACQYSNSDRPRQIATTSIGAIHGIAFNLHKDDYSAVSLSAGSEKGCFVKAAGGKPARAVGNISAIFQASAKYKLGAEIQCNQKSHGGFLNAPAISFPQTIRNASNITDHSLSARTNKTPFNVVYGIAVSGELYTDLQIAQGILVPNGADGRTPEYQPSITRTTYSSLTVNTFNSSKKNLQDLINLETKNKKITVCRGSDFSGIHTVAGEFFLNQAIGSDGEFGGALDSANSSDYGPEAALDSYEVKELNNIEEIKKCLNSSGYAIGILPLTENTLGVSLISTKYRFVKINNIPSFASEHGDFGSCCGKNVKSASTGNYEFTFPAYVFSTSSAGTLILNLIAIKIAQLNGVTGTYPSTPGNYYRSEFSDPLLQY